MGANKKIEDAIFFAALHIADAQERQEFLDTSCRDNPGMRREIEAMLSAEESASQLVDRGYSAIAESSQDLKELPDKLENDPPDELIGLQIGPYRLIESLGKGGCGEVYLAEQSKPVQRQVAFKIIKLGMDTRNIIQRFDAERQALARMDHPNIARVIDAGSTNLGKPYFVMELVRGIRITDYCRKHRCHLRQRIDMVIDVCRAIQHAHQKGIIHRDIKPSNVLIKELDGIPIPKVIDFGIAKAIEGHLAGETLYTQHEQLLGTPAYMSPEQAGIGPCDVDTRSDVYSLGALLYELVTDRPPCEISPATIKNVPEVRRIIAEQEPPRPSSLLAQMRHETAEQPSGSSMSDYPLLASKIRGELDWIIKRAMEKDRNLRYDTVNGLALDLQRFLHDEPVSARPPARLYLLRKLIRRNRVVFAFSGGIALALITGLGTSASLYVKARRAEQKQASLRQTAEWALAKEGKLRREAETREKFTEAVALTRQGDFETAADILGKLEAPPDKPSLDAVTALREVGLWLGTQKRWENAEKCYSWLFKIDKLDPWQTVTLNCQAYATLLVKTGELSEYERFCDVITDSHQKIDDGDEASRLLKSCLLRPIDLKRQKQLQPLADTSQKWLDAGAFYNLGQWAPIATCLWQFRIGNSYEAINIARASTPKLSTESAQLATYEAIVSMASKAVNDPAGARIHLDKAKDMVEKTLSIPVFSPINKVGYWYDWLFAEILVNEASALID